MKRTFSMLALAALTIGLLGSCTRIDNLEKRVDTLENDKIASIDDQIASIQSSIKKLDQIDGLSKRADELEAFVKNDLASKEWVDATYLSLKQYQITCDTVANLKEKLGQTDEKIDECVESLKDWITSEFNNYYKAAEIDAKLKALKDTTLADAIAATKEELTEGYKAAIKTAIEDNDGFVTPEIKEAIASTNDKIAALAASVDSLDEEIALVNKMVQSIDFVPMDADGKSVAVATYVNGLDTASLFLDLNLRYRVKPAAALDSILAAYANDAADICLYYKGIQTSDTRAGESGPDCLKIKYITEDIDDDGLIVLTVDGGEFNRLPVRNCISSHSTISIALGMKYGNSDIISGYNDVDFEELNFDKEMEEVYRQMAILIGSKQQGKDYNAYRVLFNMCGDDVLAAGRRFGDHDAIAALNQFRYTAHNPVIYECYTNFYKAIDACNKFICKYFDPETYEIFDARVPHGQYDSSSRCLAEARVLRAWLHFTLATGWGNPPIVDKWPAPAKPTNCEQKEIFKWCLKELEESAKTLGDPHPWAPETCCRATSLFAYALMGKILIFTGDETISTDPFRKAMEYLEHAYSCMPQIESCDFAANFHTEGNRGLEKIFELDLEKYSGFGYVEAFLLPYMGMETGLWNWYSDGFVADPIGGISPVKGAGCLGIPQKFGQTIEKGDQRLFVTIGWPENVTSTAVLESSGYDASTGLNEMNPIEILQSNKAGIKADGLYGQSLYNSRKQLVLNGDLHPATGNRTTNFIVMRSAEVLFLLAEACYRAGDEAKALTYINFCRARAGLANLTLLPDGLSSVMLEKQHELWMEGCNWVDIVRLKNKLKNVDYLKEAGKTIPVLYDKFTREPKATDNIIAWDGKYSGQSRFYTVNVPNKAYEHGAEVGFKEGKHEYFPFPADVISANHNLHQHTGW